ncbi:MAG: hypothetical protein JWM49_1024 [Microbacteriaceae bacterium]|nr:hypothetical protein [Microbacteriaceae bacterium]
MAAAVRRLLHGADRGIRVVRDDDAAGGRDMQVAEQVALAEGGHEHLLGVPAVDVSVKDPGG